MKLTDPIVLSETTQRVIAILLVAFFVLTFIALLQPGRGACAWKNDTCREPIPLKVVYRPHTVQDCLNWKLDGDVLVRCVADAQ